MIKSFTVDSTCNNMRLDRWLRNKLGNIPQGLIEKNLRLGKIKINKKKIPLTIVKPGSQSRKFTHIADTIKVCYEAWKKNKCAHYSISHKQSYSIFEIAKMFKTKIRYIKARPGERYASSLVKMSLNNKIIQRFGKINLKDYITSFIKS